ncbi:MAG: glycosyltransferase [Eubacterium sp.]|nr:glycosyltransferase [Eubacterium sp.]
MAMAKKIFEYITMRCFTLKISVLMTTFNGQTYIYEQLLSIYEQTISPNEVIICDDCSTDETASIIHHFINEHSLKNWHLIVNPQNKGWQRNFIETLSKVSGSYIFFSDQDDIWYKEKVETMIHIMEKQPEIQCLSGKMTTIDANGLSFKGKNIFSTDRFSGTLNKLPFSACFNTSILQGCTMCITKKLADLILKMNIKDCGHDVQCCRLGILLDGTFILDEPVMHYRLHGQNTSGVKSDINYGTSNLQKRTDVIRKNIVWLNRLLEISESEKFLNQEKRDIIKETIVFQKDRFRFLTRKNILLFFKLFKYRKYYSGLSMYIGDFSYAFHINKLTGKILWLLKDKKTFTD